MKLAYDDLQKAIESIVEVTEKVEDKKSDHYKLCCQLQVKCLEERAVCFAYVGAMERCREDLERAKALAKD